MHEVSTASRIWTPTHSIMTKNVMPRSTAVRRSAIISCLSAGGPYEKLIPMQPNPKAETSRPLFPNVRFCIVFSFHPFRPTGPQETIRCSHPCATFLIIRSMPQPQRFKPVMGEGAGLDRLRSTGYASDWHDQTARRNYPQLRNREVWKSPAESGGSMGRSICDRIPPCTAT